MSSPSAPMRLREALREAARDVGSGAGRALTFAAAFLLAAGGPAFGGALSSLHTIGAARDYVGAGAATYVVKAEARIDGRACEALTDAANVRASGALRAADAPLRAAALPDTPIPLYAVSHGFADVLGVVPDGSGLLMSASVGRSLGVRTADVLETTRGAVPVVAEFDYPDDGRDPLLAFSALERAPDDGRRFDACWALIWPADEHAVSALGRTVVTGGSEGEHALLTQLNPSHGAHFDPNTPFGRTPAVVLAATVGLAVGVASVARRRLAIASDLHVGVGRGAIVTSLVAQTVSWALCGGSAALAAIATLAGVDDADRLPILLQSALVIAAAGSAAIGGTALMAGLVREKALFRYFRSR